MPLAQESKTQRLARPSLQRLTIHTASDNGVPDAGNFHLLDLVRDDRRRFLHGEEQAVTQMHRRGSGFRFDEDDVFAVQQNFAALVDAVELDQWHGAIVPELL